MKNYTEINLNINGFPINARYFREDITNLFLPLIHALSDMQRNKKGRLIVYLAAPPGAGKTTLSLFLSHLSRTAQVSETTQSLSRIQSVGMDGFHYPQEYIERHYVTIGGKPIPMRNVKGSPESYDLLKLTDSIKLLREEGIVWPIYDRKLHDVVPDAVPIQDDIVLIEGNWLLLDEPGWRELKSFCDYSIFVTADACTLKDRLIQRKVAGGLSQEQAEIFYAQSDSVNVSRSLKFCLPSDYRLVLTQDGKYSLS